MQGSFSIRLARTGEFLLGALFLCAAVLKLANVPLFASQILSYEVIKDPKLVALTAEILVPLEAALGLAMLAGIRLRGAIFYAAIAMLLFFSVLVAYAWPQNCGCFGPIKLGPVETLAKNAIMFLIAAYGAAMLKNQGDTEPQFHPVGKWLTVILLTALAGYFAHDELYNSAKYFSKEPVKKQEAAPVATSAPTPTPAPQTAAPAAVAPAPAASTPTPPAPAPPAPAMPVPAAPAPATAPDAASSDDAAAYPTKWSATEDYPADAPAIFSEFTLNGQDGKPLELGKGTYLVAILNATCDHCMHTVPAINELAVRPDVPTVVALVQEPDPGSLDLFVQQTGASFPTLSMGNDFIKFSSFVKKAPPRFTLERDGKPLKSWEDYPPTAEELQQAVPK